MADNLTIGIIGQGKTSPESATALLDNFIDSREVADDELRFVFALDETWDEVKSEIWEYYEDFDYEVVYNDDGADLKVAKALLKDAASKHKVQRVDKKIVQILDNVEGEAALVVLWDHDSEDPEVGYKAAEEADKAGIKVYDLTDAMDVVSFAGEDEEVEEDEEKEEEVEAEEPEEAEEEEDEDTDKEEAEVADGPYTRDELEAMNREDVKALAVKAGLVDKKSKTHTKTLVSLLLDHYDEADAAYGEDVEKNQKAEEKPSRKREGKKDEKKKDDPVEEKSTPEMVSVSEATAHISDSLTKALDKRLKEWQTEIVNEITGAVAEALSKNGATAEEPDEEEEEEEEEAPRRKRPSGKRRARR